MLSQAQIANAWGHACYKGKFATVTLFGGGQVSIRPEILQATSALSICLRVFGYHSEPSDTGGFVCRHKTDSSEVSNHGRGIAIDINWRSNPYGHTLSTNMPFPMVQAICGIRTNSGARVWNWGGNWSGNKDAMHYEIVCTPADLRTGINWATVPALKLDNPLPHGDHAMGVIIKNPHDPRQQWYTDLVVKRPIGNPTSATGIAIVLVSQGSPNPGPFDVQPEFFDDLKIAAEYIEKVA